MRHRVRLPPLGDGVETATVLEWACQVGESVAVGQSLVAVELDKVDTEVPAPVEGTLVEQAVAEGDEVRVGDVLCVVES